MTQANRSDLVSRPFAAPTRPSAVQRLEIAVATGREAPVTSPALELQRALDDMLSTVPNPPLDPARLVLFGTAMLGAAAVCVGFWWTALSWTASLLS